MWRRKTIIPLRCYIYYTRKGASFFKTETTWYHPPLTYPYMTRGTEASKEDCTERKVESCQVKGSKTFACESASGEGPACQSAVLSTLLGLSPGRLLVS